jgi:hypothetical protein
MRFAIYLILLGMLAWMQPSTAWAADELSAISTLAPRCETDYRPPCTETRYSPCGELMFPVVPPVIAAGQSREMRGDLGWHPAPLADGGRLRVVIRIASQGRLTLGERTGLTFESGDGISDTQLIFSAPIDQAVAALDSLQLGILPNARGLASVYISAAPADAVAPSSEGNASSDASAPVATVFHVSIDTPDQNDAPNVIPPDPSALDEDVVTPLQRIVLADADAGSGEMSVTLLAGHGLLVASPIDGVAATRAANGALVLKGQLEAVNAALSALSYVPVTDFNGSDAIQIAGSDAQKALASGTLDVTVKAVNDAPRWLAPGGIAQQEDRVGDFGALGLADPDVSSGTLNLLLSVAHGTLSAGNRPAKNRSLAIQGTLATLNTALAQVRYHPDADYCGPDALTLSADDQGGSGSGGAKQTVTSVPISVAAVNDPPEVVLNAPSLAGTDPSVWYRTGQPAVKVCDALANIADIDSPTLAGMKVIVANAPSGSTEALAVDVAGSGLASTYDATRHLLTITGAASPEVYQQVLRTLTFQYQTPTAYANWQRRVEVVVDDGEVATLKSAYVNVTLGNAVRGWEMFE